MTTGFKAILYIVLSSILAAQGSAAGATPMQKVLDLLKDLSAKLEAEGAQEAAEYDKFACFCKEQADQKQYAIDKSDKKLAYLKAEIAELETAKKTLENDMISLSEEIHESTEKINKKTEAREAEHEKYTKADEDISEAIDSCERAIEAVKNAKSNLKGAKINLAEVTGLLQMVQKRSLLSEADKSAAFLSKFDEKGAPKFEYQSNDILATIEDLLATFKSQKANLDADEGKANSAFEKSRLALETVRGFSEKERAEKESIAEAKTDELHEMAGFRQNEEADRQADYEFTQKLSDECSDKAELFDRNSKMRADELKVLADASRELHKNAVPNDKATRTRVGLQPSDEVMDRMSKMTEIQMPQPPKPEKASLSEPVAFVQINKVEQRASDGEEAVQRAHSFLVDAAERTESSALSAIAVRVAVSNAPGPDHYVKVRDLIKDLLQKLEDDATAEADQKTTCDKGIKQATSERDSANAQIEEFTAKVTVLKSQKIGELTDDNQRMTKQIAELKKAQLEATELADKEEDDLKKQRAMCEAGAESVESALSLLEGFYSEPAGSKLLQTGRWKPFNSSRDGDTVADLAPDTFDTSYHGAKDESSGIIGILEVVLADFQRSERQSVSDMEESVAARKKFQESTDADVKQKQESIKKNKASITDYNGQLLDTEASLKDANSLLDSALKQLEGWEEMCVKGEVTWEEREKQRKEEIGALNEAMRILENWQPSL